MHVAIDTSSKGTGGINGPIFPDKSFEFIPIPENPKNTSETRTYSTLKAKNSKNGKFLSDFVPSDIQDYLVHFDQILKILPMPIQLRQENHQIVEVC